MCSLEAGQKTALLWGGVHNVCNGGQEYYANTQIIEVGMGTKSYGLFW